MFPVIWVFESLCIVQTFYSIKKRLNYQIEHCRVLKNAHAELAHVAFEKGRDWELICESIWVKWFKNHGKVMERVVGSKS